MSKFIRSPRREATQFPVHQYSRTFPVVGTVSSRTLILLLILPALIIYFCFVSNRFFFDDQSINWMTVADEFPAAVQPRLVAAVFNWANGTLLGLTSANFRLVNLALHLANTLLIFFLGRRLLAVVYPDQPGKDRQTELAFAGALLFSIHPVAVYAVGYAIQRTMLLATLFSLLAAWCHLRAQTEKRPELFGAAVACYALAVFSKEHSVMLPAALAVLSAWLSVRGQRWQWRWLPTFAAYLAITVWITYLVKSYVPLGGVYEPTAQLGALVPDHPYLRSITSQFIFFFKYLGLWILPNPSWMSIDLQSDLPAHVLPWEAIGGVVAFTSFTIVLWRTFRRPGTAGFLSLAGCWAVVLFASELWATRLSESFVLYRSYLWMCWIPLAVSVAVYGALQAVPFAARIVPIMLLGATVGLGAILWERLTTMSSDLRLWEDAVAKNRGSTWPGGARALHNLGLRHYEAGHVALGIVHYQQALKLNPNFYYTLCRLGYLSLNNKATLDQALTYFTRATAAAIPAGAPPASPAAKCGPLGIIMAHEQKGEYPQALAGVRKYIALWPGDSELLIDMAVLQFRMGRLQEANETLNIARHVLPEENALVHFNIALIQERQQKLAEAVATVDEGLRKLPDNTRLLAYGSYLHDRTDKHLPMKMWQPQRPSLDF